ncbi:MULTISPECIES: DUF1858 domain-containing protein [Enterococcus]|uniref:DUF1858 domain-containing protein n=1 Tax=Enterococcus TaxID=1350 RepID=UPI00065E2B96|nr:MULTISPECIES: DUF1858 domain-containing protein [Enterococcus]KAF1304980.1 hypothetical protein BAU16_00220 [Enterococcus sp. JM9B]
MKTIDFSRSLFDLVSEFPEIKDIMYSIGFEAITKPGMLQTAGRYVTIPKGAQMKKIPLETVVAAFEAQGFTVEGAK